MTESQWIVPVQWFDAISRAVIAEMHGIVAAGLDRNGARSNER
jgi:hypothetical protein